MSSSISLSEGIRKKAKTDVSDITDLTFSFFNPPSKLVFSNFLIMKQIFSNLKVNDLKGCRLVCHQWNEIVTPVTSTKCAVNLNKLFSQPQETIISMPTISSALVKYLTITFDGSEDEVLNSLDIELSRSMQLLFFCEKFKDYIRGIEISNSDGNDAIRPLRRIFKICKNLEELSLLYYGSRNEKEDLIVDSKDLLPKSLNLKKIELLPRCYVFPSHLQRFVSNIIRASHNLIHLDLAGNCYPDLSCNSKLKILFVINLKYYYTPEFSLSKLEEMIKQVSASLEELKLFKENRPHLVSAVTGNFTLPKMPKLKTFVNRALHIYPMESIASLGECPNLSRLVLVGRSLENCGMDYFFENSKNLSNSKIFSRVTMLGVVQFKNVSAVETLVSFFPSLSKFAFRFGLDNAINMTNEEIQNQTKSMFGALSKLTKLKDLKIGFLWYCEFNTLVNAFSNHSEFFRGLKGLPIYNGKIGVQFVVGCNILGFKTCTSRNKEYGRLQALCFSYGSH